MNIEEYKDLAHNVLKPHLSGSAIISTMSGTCNCCSCKWTFYKEHGRNVGLLWLWKGNSWDHELHILQQMSQ